MKYQDGRNHAGQAISLEAAQMICSVCGEQLYSTDYAAILIHTHKSAPSRIKLGFCAICHAPNEPYLVGGTHIGPHV